MLVVVGTITFLQRKPLSTKLNGRRTGNVGYFIYLFFFKGRNVYPELPTDTPTHNYKKEK